MIQTCFDFILLKSFTNEIILSEIPNDIDHSTALEKKLIKVFISSSNN